MSDKGVRVSLHTDPPEGIVPGDSTFISWSAPTGNPETITAAVVGDVVLVKCRTCGEFVDIDDASKVETPTGIDWYCAEDK